MHVTLLCIAYVVSGTLSTLASQLLIYQGAAETSSMLIPLFNYIGMMFIEVFASCGKRERDGKVPETPMQGDQRVLPVPHRSVAVPHSPLSSELPPQPRSRRISKTEPGIESAVAQQPSEMIETQVELVTHSAVRPLPRSRRNSASSQEYNRDNVAVSLTAESRDMLVATTSTEKPLLQFASIRFSENLFVAIVAGVDLAGLVLVLLAIQFAGSGLFEVVYSSVVAWSAVLAWYCLRKRTTMLQVIGIATVMFGLAFDTLGEMFHSENPVDAQSVNERGMWIGSMLSIAAALVYAFSFVLSEGVMSGPHAPDSKRVASRMGVVATGACSLYVIAFTIPRWNSEVSEPVQDAHGDIYVIVSAYVVMMVSQVINMVSYFQLVGKVGAVTTGMLGGLRSAILFFVSALLFCSYQEAQCLTMSRVVSAVIVIGGVLVYSRGQHDDTMTTVHQSFAPVPTDDSNEVESCSAPLSGTDSDSMPDSDEASPIAAVGAVTPFRYSPFAIRATTPDLAVSA